MLASQCNNNLETMHHHHHRATATTCSNVGHFALPKLCSSNKELSITRRCETMATDNDTAKSMSNHRSNNDRNAKETFSKCRIFTRTTHTLCTALLFCWTFFYLLRTTHSQYLDAARSCDVIDVNGTVTGYSACVGSTESFPYIGLMSAVDPQNATCGSRSDFNSNLFCPLFGETSLRPCNLCDAADPVLEHPPSFLTDRNGADTWWQSVSWYDYPTPLAVNITISLGHSYLLVGDLTFTFENGRPQLMVLEKSSDNGATWEVYQYYAARDLGCTLFDEGCSGGAISGCQRVFGMSATSDATLTSPTQVICTDEYSSLVRVSDRDVKFLVEERYLLLTNSFLLADHAAAYEANPAFQAFVDVTDIRLQMLYPATDGLEFSAQYQYDGHGKYYYAISEIDTYVICNCNLHGKYCISDNSGGINETICDCRHNTQGKNCEECKPLYNNRMWLPGSNLPYPIGTANECEKCDCGDHADSCVYDAELGFGTCVDCRDNTAGLLCEICVDGYFRNTTALKTDPNVCIECTCEPLGTILNESNVTTCTQYAVGDLPVGQCNCKDNIRGRACDMCAEGFYGLVQEPNPGNCKACGCNLLGTVGGSNVCKEMTGQCPCKTSTTTRECSECKDTYYTFPGTVGAECLSCGCDPGGASSLVCSKATGRCPCRGNISGRQCSNPATLYYCSYLDSNMYDAWEASSTCVQTASNPIDSFLYTGGGYQLCSSGSQVVFEGVTVATGSDTVTFTRGYYPTVRYSYTSDYDWESAQLTALATGDAVNASCPDIAGTQVWTSAMLFSPGSAMAATSSQLEPVILDRRCTYQFTLEIQRTTGLGGRMIEIDALVMMPNINETLVHQIADPGQQQLYEICMLEISALSTRSSVIDTCRAFSFSVCAELYGGAQSCMCDPVGSLGSVCVSYGGDCNCKPGIGGRQCDKCLPGYYNFTTNGCTACNCDEQGSDSLACNIVTGQCPCREGIALDREPNEEGQVSGLQCRKCRENFFGFGNLLGCVECGCDVIGSVTPQCDGDGVCNCKETITGDQCANCVPGYFGFSAEGCQSCECDPAGTLGSTCHPTQGTCQCKLNVEGDKCDQCRPGFFNMQLMNPSGCQSCFCFEHGTQCGSATGYVMSEVKTDFTRGRNDGWITTDSTALNTQPSYIKISHPPNLDAGTFIYLLAPDKFLGFQLSSYGQGFSYRMKLDTGLVNRADTKYLVMSGGRLGGMTFYYSSEAFEPMIEATTFEAVMYESQWMVDGEDRNPTHTEFLEMLSSIASIQIKATFGSGTASTFYSIAMETAGEGQLTDGGNYVTTVENCTCGDNTMGLSCQSCNIGHRRTDGLSDPYDTCIACNCNGRATECDPETGICLDCRLGTAGNQCQDCALNVQPPNCDRCVFGYYGFETDMFGGACEACNCSAVGTGNNLQCDNLSGQCPCTGNYGGQTCDMCDVNFFDYASGCRACDSCYDGIDSQYAILDVFNTNLTSYVELLLFMDPTLDVGSFMERLNTIQSLLLDLVTRTQTVIQEGEDLSAIITSLNTTMFQLLATLDGPIEEGLALAAESVTSVEEGVAISQEIIQMTETSLTDAHYAITGGDIQQAQTVLTGLNSDLGAIRNQFNTLTTQSGFRVSALESQVDVMDVIATDTVRTAESAVQLAQEANAIHDDTTARTAVLFVLAGQVDEDVDRTGSEAVDAQQRAELTKFDSNAKRSEVTAINVGQQSTDALVNNAMGRVQQAAQIEQNANDQLVVSQEIINSVNLASIDNEYLLVNANATIDLVNGLFDRVTVADEKASGARDLSNSLFNEGSLTLELLRDFNAEITDAKNAAATSLTAAPGLVQTSNAVIGQATALRNQLTQVTSDASEGLGVAEEAYATAEIERLNLLPVNARADLLAQASATSTLNAIDSIATTIDSANTTLVQPAGQICESYTPGIQTLENMVSDAITDSAAVTARTVATGQEIALLLNEIENIGAIGTADLSDLLQRVQAAKLVFSQGQFDVAIRSLKLAVEEQATWLADTQAEVTVMQEPTAALESFRIQ